MNTKTNKLIPELRFPEFVNEGEWIHIKVEDLIEQYIEKSDITNQYPVLTSSREGIMFQRDYYNNRDIASTDNSGYNVVPRGYFTYRHMSDDLIFKFNINTICDRGIVSTLYPVFSVNENKILPFFLQQKLNEGLEFRNFAISQKQGGSRTYMYLNKLKELNLLIPNLQEQQKICDCISPLDDLIIAHTGKLETLKAYKKGLIQNLFPKNGEKIPKLRFKEFEKDEQWKYLNGNELFDTISNKNHNSDLPILAITQEQGAIPRNLINYNVVVTEKSIESYKVVEIGDFIISLRSFQGGIEYSNYKGICSPAYIILRKKNENSENEFYKHYFKTDSYIRNLNKNLEGLRDGKMVSYSQFSEIQIPNPNPKEQKKIANTLSSLDELIKEQADKIEQLKLHKKGLMQGLFPKVKN